MKALTTEQITAELERMLFDPVYSLKMLFPHWFPDKMPWFHRGILAVLTRQTGFLNLYGELDKIVENFVYSEDPWDSESPTRPLFQFNENGGLDLEVAPYTLIMLPRGFSKTTLLNGLNTHRTLFKLKKFIVYVSHASTHADLQLANVQSQLESNELIKTLFGNLKPGRETGLAWSDGFFQTTTGVNFLARGRGSQIRGQNIDAQRPDCIMLDDVEDREAVKTDEQRIKSKEWLYRDVLPALPRRDPSASLEVLGTLLHSDSLLVTLSRDPRFNTIRFACVAKDGSPLWPEHMNEQQIEIERQAMARAGDLTGFYLEYFNQIRGTEDSKFRADMFIHGSVKLDDDYMVAMAIDPAISEKPGADFCAIAVVAMHLKSGKHFILDTWAQRGATPRMQVDKYFELSKLWKVKHHGVEAIAYQAALVHLLREDMFRQKHYFELTEIRHRDKKDERILGILQPRYQNGYIIHTKRFGLLETQLLDYPNGKKDLPDAVAMAISLLDPYAAAAADPTLDLGEDEYEELKEWRRF